MTTTLRPRSRSTPDAPAPHRPSPPAATPRSAAPLAIEVGWARHQSDVRAAQRLRHQVFAGELGAKIRTPLPGHDIDRFDDYCEHLLVRDRASGEVVGTYRLLTPAQARRAGGTYGDQEFNLAPLAALRPTMVELGRSCVRDGWRQGGVILALWSALAEFALRNRLDTMIGCASIPMNEAGTASGRAAAGIWHNVRQRHLAAPEWRVKPRLALPVDGFDGLATVEPPALIKGYLRLGARVLGPPAWDPDFNTADLPMLMRIADLPARYQRAPHHAA